MAVSILNRLKKKSIIVNLCSGVVFENLEWKNRDEFSYKEYPISSESEYE